MKHSNQKMANPNVLTRTKTNTPRHAFNMSHDVYMHSPVGMLVPSFTQDIKPNDFFKLDISSYARTVPVNTAAFCRMTEYTDFYFVPMSQIWKPFDQMENPVPDVRSALALASQKANNVSSMPYISMKQLLAMFTEPTAGSSAQQYMFNVSPKAYAARILDQLGYFSNPNKPWHPVSGANIDEPWMNSVNYYFDENQRFNPYRILAFNRILNDYYRQTDYVSSDARLFNIDDIESNTQIPDARLRAILRCGIPADASENYVTNCIFPFVKWNLDKLTATKPNQLYGSFTNPTNVNADSTFGKLSDSGSVYSTGQIMDAVTSNTQDLRISQALEKIARVSMSAPKTFKAQQEAHFGVSSESCDNNSIRYLGSYRSDLEIGEVVATTNYDSGDSSNYLGQIAGKGTCKNSRNGVIELHSKSFGVIIGVHYVKPEAEYQMNRLNTLVTRFNRSDFFVPEFDQLGLEPTYKGEFAATGSNNMDVMGYRSRYSNLKSRVSEVHGNFQKGRSMSAWAMSRNYDNVLATNFTIHRFFVDPRVSDSIFEHNFDGTEVTDQFICHYLYHATLVSDMSINGTPTL